MHLPNSLDIHTSPTMYLHNNLEILTSLQLHINMNRILLMIQIAAIDTVVPTISQMSAKVLEPAIDHTEPIRTVLTESNIPFAPTSLQQ